jgi:hypothetical protein
MEKEKRCDYLIHETITNFDSYDFLTILLKRNHSK